MYSDRLGKRKRLLKPSYKSTWTVDKLLSQVLGDILVRIEEDRLPFSFTKEGLSTKFRAKVEIVSAMIQKLRLKIPKGYYIGEYNDAPHESSRNKFFWHGPNKGGWAATVYTINKITSDLE